MFNNWPQKKLEYFCGLLGKVSWVKGDFLPWTFLFLMDGIHLLF